MKDDIESLDRLRADNKRAFIGKWATQLSGRVVRFIYVTRPLKIDDDEVTQFLVDLENIAGRMFDDAIATECQT